jgi:hypothetical protein
MFFDDPKSSIPEDRTIKFRLLGTGNGTVPTIDKGKGITASWTATGRILLTFVDNPGGFVTLHGSFGDTTTQSNVKGWTMTHGAYPATANTCTIEVDFWNSSFAAADLATTSYAHLTFTFSATSAA